eukprot:jgi/Mesvir1/24482/Mv21839-RA.1
MWISQPYRCFTPPPSLPKQQHGEHQQCRPVQQFQPADPPSAPTSPYEYRSPGSPHKPISPRKPSGSPRYGNNDRVPDSHMQGGKHNRSMSCTSNTDLDLIVSLHNKFQSTKRQIDVELHTFCKDVATQQAKERSQGKKSDPRWLMVMEQLLQIAHACIVTHVDEFKSQIKDVVKELETERQLLGARPDMHQGQHLVTRLLFILARASRLLQFSDAEDASGAGASSAQQGCLNLTMPRRPRKEDIMRRSESSMASMLPPPSASPFKASAAIREGSPGYGSAPQSPHSPGDHPLSQGQAPFMPGSPQGSGLLEAVRARIRSLQVKQGGDAEMPDADTLSAAGGASSSSPDGGGGAGGSAAAAQFLMPGDINLRRISVGSEEDKKSDGGGGGGKQWASPKHAHRRPPMSPHASSPVAHGAPRGPRESSLSPGGGSSPTKSALSPHAQSLSRAHILSPKSPLSRAHSEREGGFLGDAMTPTGAVASPVASEGRGQGDVISPLARQATISHASGSAGPKSPTKSARSDSKSPRSPRSPKSPKSPRRRTPRSPRSPKSARRRSKDQGSPRAGSGEGGSVSGGTPRVGGEFAPPESAGRVASLSSLGVGRRMSMSVRQQQELLCRICEEAVPSHLLEEHSRICLIVSKTDVKSATDDQRLSKLATALEERIESEDDEAAAVPMDDSAPWRGGRSKRASCDVDGDISVMRYLATLARCAIAILPDHPTAYADSARLLQSMQELLEGQRGTLPPAVSIFGKRMEAILKEKVNKLRLIANASNDSAPGSAHPGSARAQSMETDERDVSRNKSDSDADQPGSGVPAHGSGGAGGARGGAGGEGMWASAVATPSSARVGERTTIADFEIIKPISRGAFGRVFLARKRTTGDLFAIKVLKKADMIRKNAVDSVNAERHALSAMPAHNPYVVNFYYSFTSKENLYIVMEYVNGGDCYSLLHGMGCLDEDIARIYIAETVLALEGEGVAAGSISRSPTVKEKEKMVGTPDYLAPEILLGTGHGPEVDWWSLGAILYEFITGTPPFNAETPQDIFDNIMNRDIVWPSVPEDMSYEAKDLIDKLLTSDPNKRLGHNGAAEVKAHPYFYGVDWNTLVQQKAVFIPKTENEQDTSYFKPRGAPADEPHEDGNYSDSGDSEGSFNDLDEEGFQLEGDLDATQMSPSTAFQNFSFKNIPQLAHHNIELLKSHYEEFDGEDDGDYEYEDEEGLEYEDEYNE